jgi:hypothetical protein
MKLALATRPLMIYCAAQVAEKYIADKKTKIETGKQMVTGID